jgi:DNA (cytosine-5)-methyltransferase 1
VSRPLLLDLFCGAGGATKGYQNAGFFVVGVDINRQPNYCGDAFIQADALDLLQDASPQYDAIHASPPCQRYSAMSACRPGLSQDYPDLVTSLSEPASHG